MSLKKLIQVGDVVCEYHSIHSVVMNSDGTCTALVGSYTNEIDAALNRNPVDLLPVVCNGVSQDEKTIQQIYCILAGMDRYSGAHGTSPESIYGVNNPQQSKPNKPQQPSPWHTWNIQSWCWEVSPESLAKAKEAASQSITVDRDIAERSGFLAYGKVFDSDDKSIQRILGAAQAALFAKQQSIPLNIEWTCADNSTIVLDEDMLSNMPVILAQASDVLHQKSRSLKQQIYEADSIESIQSIKW